MMSEQDLVEIVQIAVADLNHEGHQTGESSSKSKKHMGRAGRCVVLYCAFLMKLDVLENNEDADQPGRKRARMDISQEATIKVAS